MQPPSAERAQAGTENNQHEAFLGVWLIFLGGSAVAF